MQPEVLATDVKWLRSNGYVIADFDAGDWKSEEQMHDALKSALSFPDYYGKNLDALDECMCEDVVVPDEGGLVLILRHYDQFAKAIQIDRADARSLPEVVLHIFARAVRVSHALRSKTNDRCAIRRCANAF